MSSSLKYSTAKTYTFDRAEYDKQNYEPEVIRKPSFMGDRKETPTRTSHTYQFVSRPSMSRSPVRDYNLGTPSSSNIDHFKKTLDDQLAQRKVISTFGYTPSSPARDITSSAYLSKPEVIYSN